MVKNNQKGTTMVETIMYVSVLIILGGILAGYVGRAFERYKIGRANQQVIDLKKAIVQFTAADENYTKLSAANMNKGNSLPLDMRGIDPNTAYHALNGIIDIGPVTDLLGDNEDYKFLFYITFNNVSKRACVEIITQGQFYGDGSDMDTLIINDIHGWQFKHSYYDKSELTDNHILESGNTAKTFSPNIRPTISQAVSSCSEISNKITWIFS